MLLETYWTEVNGLYSRIRSTQRENIISAGKMIADSAANGGCIHIHDTGHIIDAELVGRGGGLLLYKQFKYNLHVDNPVRTRDRSDMDTNMEGLAKYAVKRSGAKPGDVFIIGSVSGRSFSAVDLAFEAKKMGMKCIVITSMAYGDSVAAVHSCGKKLFEMADIVIDNCAPAAESMMEVEGLEARLCAASGLSAAYIMWSVTTVVVEELLRLGKNPSIYKSHNFPGGGEYNRDVSIPRYESEGI
ncbi:MAG: sugar isomerase domain-containing protein [Defluviitaleaceae bacterium]|nr:sugar isomerase domain-containing protein [Defluviitaleaceae bacterium]